MGFIEMSLTEPLKGHNQITFAFGTQITVRSVHSGEKGLAGKPGVGKRQENMAPEQGQWSGDAEERGHPGRA